jgi:CCR4-NOT complex subunit CAF16
MGIAADSEENAVEVTDLEFAYGGQAPFISKFSLKLKRGSRCLLIGANGAGKFHFTEAYDSFHFN